ncbi:MAG TPA: sodium-dependent transporter [Chlamydiales bacterium]|nr:sodium-dependent transporter [Chlamydiales bacterium]HPE84655.1 sodium-dependent transporter [Chlamydiales bacterium]
MRGNWKSSLGFVLATSGAAVGLGNIQRFPYIVSQAGGAGFVFIYLLCVLLIGVPLILVEFAIGRHTQRNPVCAIERIRPGSRWKWVGGLGIITAFCILSYYSVVAGWTLGYIVQMTTGRVEEIHQFAADPLKVIGYMVAFIGIVMAVVSKGIHKGIERWSKILMPILAVLLLGLIARALTLPGAWEGVKYYLDPDFSEITGHSVLLALGQAFFSLCVGEAVLVTYGSYASKSENLIRSGISIALFDTAIAFLAGLVIFPALFAFGKSPTQGVGLTFAVLPDIFLQMPWGQFFGVLFFVLLAFAAITTGIALLEIPVIYFIDSKKWSRKKAVWVVGIAAAILGIPSALSHGANLNLSELDLGIMHFKGFYNIMDFAWGNLAMVVTGGLLAVFAAWVWGVKGAADELAVGSNFKRLRPIWIALVKYVIPIAILFIMLGIFII